MGATSPLRTQVDGARSGSHTLAIRSDLDQADRVPGIVLGQEDRAPIAVPDQAADQPHATGQPRPPTPDELAQLLRRGTDEVIRAADLARLLRSADRPLRIKFGVDPSSADLHLGHTVCFRKLRQFQELGHTIVVIIGDWTAQIGDPSGRSATRRMLSAAEVQANAKTYTDQLFRVLDRANVEVRWQSEWFGGFTLEHVFRLAAGATVAQLLAREDFRTRFEANQPLAVVELLYPLLQAHDSVAVRADVELGGTDQRFNLLLGRELQGQAGQPPQQVVMVPLLVGTDGKQKMSKSLGNSIPIVDGPDEMLGKVMSLPDSAIVQYLELVTDVPDAEVRQIAAELTAGTVNPRDVKLRLAREIVTQFHGSATAQEAEAHFVQRFSRRELPSEIPEVAVSDAWLGRPVGLIDVLVATGLATSRADARRLIQGGGVALEGARQTDPAALVTVERGTVLQVGRRRIVRIAGRDDD
jgi:tyrosyl-tRNA synthetase